MMGSLGLLQRQVDTTKSSEIKQSQDVYEEWKKK